jgi:hypothetical protein
MIARSRAALGVGLLALLAVAAVLALAPATARADGDPASDVLILQNVYYPYEPPVSAQVRAQLDDLTKRAARAGFPIKVALIAARADLGVVPEMLGRAQRYARFLEPEIVYNRPVPLLTVMANGYGTRATGPRGPATVAALPAPGAGSDALARGAIVAVQRLAAANGHALDVSGLGSGKQPSSGGGAPLALVFAPLALLLVALGAVSLRARRRSRSPADG